MRTFILLILLLFMCTDQNLDKYKKGIVIDKQYLWIEQLYYFKVNKNNKIYKIYVTPKLFKTYKIGDTI